MESIPKSLSVNSLNQWINSDYQNPVIIDVRELAEIDIAPFPYTTIHIPISEVSYKNVLSQINNFENKEFVILCHRGIRSYNFAQWILDNKLLEEVWNLEEGIEGWSIHIDSAIPRY